MCDRVSVPRRAYQGAELKGRRVTFAWDRDATRLAILTAKRNHGMARMFYPSPEWYDITESSIGKIAHVPA
jgi:hypothetical protein